MNVSRQVAINTTALFVNRLLSALMSLLVSVFLARYLGAAGYGDYSFIFAYLSFFQILTGTAIDSIVVKEITRDASTRDAVVSNAIILKITLSLLAMMASIVVADLMGYSRDIRVLIWIASFSLIFSFGSVYTALFQSQLKAAYYAIPELVVNVVFSLLMLLFILLKTSILVFVLLQSIVVLPTTVIYIVFSRRYIYFKTRFRYDAGTFRSLLNQSWPIFFSSVFITIYMRIDQVMLFRMAGAKELGLYSAGVRLAESLNILPVVFMTSIYPLLCESYVRSKDMFTKIYTRSFKYMSIVIVPIALGTTLLSSRIMFFFYGSGFLQASETLTVLIWSEIFIFLGVVFSTILTATGLQRHQLIFTLLGAVTNVILNLYLIPRHGIIGAAIATLLAYGVSGFAVQFAFKETRTFSVDYLASMAMPAVCSIPMGLFVHFAHGLNLLFVVPVGGFLYFVTLLATRTIDREDIDYIRSIFLNKEIHGDNTGSGI